MRKKKKKQTNQIREEALYIREGEEPRENIREKEEPREKKNKQTNQIREDALYIREGEEPRGKKKNQKQKEREDRD